MRKYETDDEDKTEEEYEIERVCVLRMEITLGNCV